MLKKAGSLPVLMYHYISDHPDANAVSRAEFAEHCRALAESGWRGISLAEAEGFLERGEPVPEKSALITFDDGYLDNYLHALPLLHAYGHQAVMFAVSGRLDRGTEPRAPLADVLAGRIPDMPGVNFPVREDSLGFRVRRDVFCNAAEARAMEESGVMAVAAHSRGHLGVFAGAEFSGFARPGDQPRTFYGTALGRVWGLPGFTVKPGLLHRAFIPAPEMVEAVRKLVPQDDAGAAAFFSDAGNEARLRALAERFAGKMGRMETDDERRERMWGEIAGSKADLEALLGHAVLSFCWPWGKYAEEARQLALEAGFSVLFTTREGPNPPGGATAVRRFKARNKDGGWLLSRVRLYGSPLLGALYAKLRV